MNNLPGIEPNQIATAQKVANDERKTVELCGDERAGRRCIRARGHEGDHECHTALAVHSWK